MLSATSHVKGTRNIGSGQMYDTRVYLLSATSHVKGTRNIGLGQMYDTRVYMLSATSHVKGRRNNAQLVKRVNGFEKYKKWAKLDPCFSFNKPTKQEILHFLGWSRPKFCTKTFSPHCWKESFAKIMANVQKMLKGASAEADFWHGKNIEHAEKKSSK